MSGIADMPFGGITCTAAADWLPPELAAWLATLPEGAAAVTCPRCDGTGDQNAGIAVEVSPCPDCASSLSGVYAGRPGWVLR